MKLPSRQRLVALGFVAAPVLTTLLAGVAVLQRQRAERLEAEAAAAVADVRRALAALPAPAPQVARPTASRLAERPDVVGTLADLEALAAAANSGLELVEPQPAKTPGKQTFQLRGRGALTDVCAFLAGVENGKRLMVLGTGKIEADDWPNVRYEFEVATYHREEAGR